MSEQETEQGGDGQGEGRQDDQEVDGRQGEEQGDQPDAPEHGSGGGAV